MLILAYKSSLKQNVGIELKGYTELHRNLLLIALVSRRLPVVCTEDGNLFAHTC